MKKGLVGLLFILGLVKSVHGQGFTEPLVCLDIIQVEQIATGFTDGEIEQLKSKYQSTIHTIVNELQEKYVHPSTEEEQIKFISDAISKVWNQFRYNENGGNLLVQNLAGQGLDCDTSAFVIADILSQFGFIPKIVNLPFHVILRTEKNKVILYVETTNSSYYRNADEVRMVYPVILGEYGFVSESPIVYNNRGLEHSRQGNKEKAIEDYTTSLELDPNYDAYFSRALTKYMLFDFQSAMEDLNQAFELYQSYEVYYTRGQCKRWIKDYEGAIEDFTRAIDLKPMEANAYYNRGINEKLLGDTEKASIDFQKAKELDPARSFSFTE